MLEVNIKGRGVKIKRKDRERKKIWYFLRILMYINDWNKMKKKIFKENSCSFNYLNMNFKFYVCSRDIGEDETISGEERMKLLHLKIRFRMSKDNVPLFSQLKARKLSRDFKVRK